MSMQKLVEDFDFEQEYRKESQAGSKTERSAPSQEPQFVDGKKCLY